MKEARPKVEAADNRVYLTYSRNCLRMVNRIDYASMTTARKHNKTFVSQVDHKALVVADEWIGFQGVTLVCMMSRPASLEVVGALHLPCHQGHALYHTGWPLRFDQVYPRIK